MSGSPTTVLRVSITALTPSRFRGSDLPTEEIRLTRRSLRPAGPGWSGWSPRTHLFLLALGLVTAVVGVVLAVQVVTAQDRRAEGRADGEALAAALEAARTDVAALGEAMAAAGPDAADARALSDLVALQAADLTPEAVAEVSAAAEGLAAVLAEPVTEPGLPASLGSPSALGERYVGADGDELEALRAQVAGQIERLAAVGDDADARAAEVDGAVARVRAAATAVIQAAQASAPGTLAATPEAAADARARVEQAVAALAALGEDPGAGSGVRAALSEYFASVDAVRISHEQAVAARLAAEEEARRLAEEEAARRAAEEEAARRAEEERRGGRGWWDWWQGPGHRPGPGRD